MAKGIQKVSMKQIARTIKILPQSGKVKDITRDAGRQAKPPGKRISKTGKIYYETRSSRSDEIFKSV